MPPAATPSPDTLHRLAASPRVLSWVAAMAEALAVPLLLVDASARLLNANMAGAGELAQGRVLTRRDGRVLPPDARDEAAFDAALRVAIDAQRKLLWRGGDVAITPVAPERRSGMQEPALLMLVLRAEADAADACRLFAYQYGLTASELDVLLGLAQGRSPARIAKARGVQVGTVRAQLARLRRKCGEDSLGTLLPRLLALPPVAAPAGTRRPPPRRRPGPHSRGKPEPPA